MSGVLFVVATPIGNLEDVSQRALATLAAADIIACEDTRHSRRLLDACGIDRPLLPLHQHNERGGEHHPRQTGENPQNGARLFAAASSAAARLPLRCRLH